MEPEIIDISTLDIPSSSTDSNFGSGIELLMNEKKAPSGSSGNNSENIEMDDLEKLETELNDMANIGASKSSIFTDTINEPINLNRPSVSFNDSNIGEDTASNANPSTSTWDGFNKFNEIPVNPERSSVPLQPQSKEELLREKFQLLRKLESLESKGVQLSKKYSMDSPILEMKGEYETIMDEKAKQNSIKFQGNMLMTCINGLEYLNGRFDPFDIKLDGWSEQVGENIDDYDEVFAELYDKYKSKATMAPEIRLLFQLGGSAAMLHMTNSMFKSAMPGMDDVLRQNPDLAQQFQKAAMNSMGNSNPGFSGFMNSMSESDTMRSPGGMAPPPPMATQGPGSAPPPQSRPGNNNSFSTRPDLTSSFGQSSDGIDISEKFSSATAPERSMRPNVQPPINTPSSQPVRAEMKGPSDIDSLLSGLKTKKINMSNESNISPVVEESYMSPTSRPVSMSIPPLEMNNESSTISISDLKELQSSGGNAPKKSRRRKTSEKNTVSLDI
jgi:hypothetical protein